MTRHSIVLALAACFAQATAVHAAEPLKLGALVPITGAGALGESAQVAVELAVKHINEKGGIAGRPVTLMLADYQTDATISVAEANRLLHQAKVDLVVGPTYSQATLAVLPLLSRSSMFSINMSGTEKLTPTVAPYSFSLLANTSTQAKRMTQNAIDNFKPKTAAIISDNGAQAKTFVAALKTELEQAGIELKGTQEYVYNSKDVTPQLLALRRLSPDVLFLFTSTGDDTANVLQSRKQLGWDVPVSGSAGVSLANQTLAAGGKEAFKNVAALGYAGFAFCPGTPRREALTRFVDSVKAAKPDAYQRYPLSYMAGWYDAVFIMKAAVEGSGGKTDGPTLAKWVEKNVSNFQGVNIGLSASAENHFAIGPDALTAIRPETLDEYGSQERTACAAPGGKSKS
ncbi:substrate-binding domain-containing protein [soil metagenome]